jgi:Fe-S-cluster containining protein
MKDLRSCLGASDRDTIDRVCELFEEVDSAAKKFKKLTGIQCPEGCGECCSRSTVETTAIEMMPLALLLWGNGEADYWMERIEAARENPVCVFFNAEPGSTIQGRCMVYEMRPLICRLFGFFTIRNKYGKYVYGSCRVIKQQYPEIYENAVKRLDEIQHPSACTDYGIRIIGMDSGYGAGIVPINHAASIALRKIGYRLEPSRFSTYV